MEEQQLKNSIIAEMATSDIQIKDKQSFEEATSKLQTIKGLRKQIDGYWGELIKAAHTTWKRLNNKKKEMLKPVETIEDMLKGKINVYLDAEEKKRQEIQAKIAAEVKERQEEIEKAIKQEADEEQKEILKMQSDLMSESVILPQKDKAISQRYIYDFKVIDESKIPCEYLMINETKIKQKIREQKGETRIPGIEIIKKRILITTQK